MSLTLVGVVEAAPEPGPGGVAALTLAAGGAVYTVTVSGQHARWAVHRISAGMVVEVRGTLPAPAAVHALRVWPVPDAPTD